MVARSCDPSEHKSSSPPHLHPERCAVEKATGLSPIRMGVNLAECRASSPFFLSVLSSTMQVGRACLLVNSMEDPFLPYEMKTYFRAGAGPQADEVA